ncbi:MAG: HPr family phosphocarrier protein [Desulfitobacteriaceae bacterium]
MECQVTVKHAEGLHARPAAEFVKAATRFKSKIDVLVDTQTANAKSILSLLKLGIKQGQSMVLRAEGPDAEEALAELSSLLEEM